MALTTDLISFTFRKRSATIKDAVFNEVTFLNWLKAKARVTSDGGTTMIRPLRHTRNTTVQAFTGTDLLDTTIQQVHTSAEFNWRFYAATVGITIEEMAKNSGKAQVVRLLDAREKDVKLSFQTQLETDLFDTTPGAKSLDCIADAVADDPTSNPSRANYGGIDRANTFWRNKYQVDVDSTLSASSTWAFSTKGISYMRTMYRKCSMGPNMDTPDLMIGTGDVYDAYEAEVPQHMRIRTKEPDVDFGFPNLRFKKAEFIYSDALTGDNTTGHRIYFLNSSTWEMPVHKDWDFKMEPFQRPINQPVMSAMVIAALNAFCLNPVRNGVLLGNKV